MYKLLFFILFFTATNTRLCAQEAAHDSASAYEYYICISGINSRQDVEDIQNNISKKTGVRFFMANRYPARYFLMRSNRLITRNEFDHFLNNPLFSILFYGEGKKAREQAILLYNKNKAVQ